MTPSHSTGDRMDLPEHKTVFVCPEHGEVSYIVAMGHGIAPLHGSCGHACERIEYVRADLLRGDDDELLGLLQRRSPLSDAPIDVEQGYERAVEVVREWLSDRRKGAVR